MVSRASDPAVREIDTRILPLLLLPVGLQRTVEEEVDRREAVTALPTSYLPGDLRQCRLGILRP